MAEGIFQMIDSCTDQGILVSKHDPSARDIEFAHDPKVSVFPSDQLELKGDVDLALRAIKKLFPTVADDAKFRPYYVAILCAAQVGLRGPTAAPALGKHTLASIVQDLVEDVGSAVKNQHLSQLTKRALSFSIVLLVAYFFVRVCVPNSKHAIALFEQLSLFSTVVTCFLLLWIGCFAGVVMSYGIRSISLGLTDLWRPDADRLSPGKRLLFSGGLTMLVGLIIRSDVVELKVGGHSIFSMPMYALTFGMLCGIGEQKLPEWVGQKAKQVLPS